jgi:PleD family two-component response regulator
LTVSVGIAQAGLGETAESWLERTDRALYDAKKKGRDRAECIVRPDETAP